MATIVAYFLAALGIVLGVFSGVAVAALVVWMLARLVETVQDHWRDWWFVLRDGFGRL